jgi:hypothetical protein
MDSLEEVRRLLAQSSDRDNPSAEALRTLFEKAWRIAVVGLSRDPAKTARRVPAYLAAKGFELVPVNPRAERLLGREAHGTLSEVAEPVDLVLLFRPSAEVAPFVREAAARPEEPAIWLQEGITAPEAVAEARADGRLVVQDLCAYKVHRALQGAPRAARGLPPAS